MSSRQTGLLPVDHVRASLDRDDDIAEAGGDRVGEKVVNVGAP